MGADFPQSEEDGCPCAPGLQSPSFNAITKYLERALVGKPTLRVDILVFSNMSSVYLVDSECRGVPVDFLLPFTEPREI